MKANRNKPKTARREIFVLTPGEKRIVGFVLITFVLGLTTKHYREARLAPPRKEQIQDHAPGSPRPVRARGETKHAPRQSKSPPPAGGPASSDLATLSAFLGKTAAAVP
ncbi:MAG TPA: hypothetical protein VK581_01200 [Chthoniobacterales bacterium]|nr:hypothetical protein [Chthoniobacterales bacterium]